MIKRIIDKMEALNIKSIKNTKNEEIEELSKLSIIERKEKVINELENKNITILQLNNLLYICNTNENLIYKYIILLNEAIDEGTWDIVSKCLNCYNLEILKEENKAIVSNMIIQYSNYMSINKMNDLKQKIYKDKEMCFRNISYKTIFFKFLKSIPKDDMEELKNKIENFNAVIKVRKSNNQPFDVDNFEALYLYFCLLLSNQIERNKNEMKIYFEDLKRLVSKLKEIDDYLENDNFEIEKKDTKKFLIIIFAILNLDSANYEDISQVANILNSPSLDEKNEMISITYKRIKREFDLEIAENFKEEVKKNNNFFTLDYKFVKDTKKIELLEESYLYNYIIENNVFKKYENKIIELLDIIFTSDLIKQLLRVVYGEDYEKVEHLLEKDYPTKKFWENVILFIPFKIKKVSGFSYRNLFKIFFSLYKLKHFTTDLEDEIFTLGAFVRTLMHERLGHFIVSYIFFMFYANSKDKDEYYNSPRMDSKIKNLNKKNYIELIGLTLAEIESNIINNANNNVKGNEGSNNLDNIYNNFSEEFYEILENKLFEGFKDIIGNEYSKMISQKLIENKKKELKSKEKKEQQNIDINNIKDEKEKNDILSAKAKEIIDILFQFILDDFNKIIKDMNIKQEAYKDPKSGSLIEILLFNDFSQEMTLKECFFLLNEENYKNTNLFKFRSEFKNIPGKNNENFLKESKEGNKIFGNLFSQYYSIYEKKAIIKQDFITKKTFRENINNNLNKKYEAFECHHTNLNVPILSDNPDYIC